MDHREAPLLAGLADYHRLDRYGFTPPAHRQGRGADPTDPTLETVRVSTRRPDGR